MAALTAISKEAYRSRSWFGPNSSAHAAHETAYPLSLSEATRALMHHPLAFLSDGKGICLYAVFGLEAGTNLYVGPDAQWKSDYLPVQLRTYPFALGQTDAGDLVLCLQEDSGLVVEGGAGRPFFNAAGELDELVAQVTDTLVKFEQGKRSCETLSKQLMDASLIKSWSITVSNASGDKSVEGLYQVDEKALNELDDAAFLELRRSGALALAYCQMMSTQHMPKLIRRAQERRTASPLAVVAPTMELDFSGFNR